MSLATQSQVDEVRGATSAGAEQHRIEMEDRRQVASAELLNRQLQQLSRVAEMVVQIRAAVVEEIGRGDKTGCRGTGQSSR
jgi:hypothetical protein